MDQVVPDCKILSGVVIVGNQRNATPRTKYASLSVKDLIPGQSISSQGEGTEARPRDAHVELGGMDKLAVPQNVNREIPVADRGHNRFEVLPDLPDGSELRVKP